MKKFNLLTIAVLAGLALAAALLPGVASAIQTAVAFVGPANIAALALMGSVAATITQGDTYTGKIPVNSQPRDAGLYPITIPFTLPATAPVANDMHLLCKLLPGVTIEDYSIDIEDIDTNGTPTADLALGEADAQNDDLGVVYKTGITIGQTGGLLRYAAASAATTLRAIGDATKNTERVIALKWITASATYAASKKGLLVLWARG